MNESFFHGGNAIAVAKALGVEVKSLLDLSASMNPFAPNVESIVRKNIDYINYYPNPTQATNEISRIMGISHEEILLTNGGSEAIALVASQLEGAYIREPEFSLYKRHLYATDSCLPRWRSNPNNPLGHLANDEEEALVWDEAFFPLATGNWTRGDISRGSIVIGSLTKIFSCPGLRIGYIMSKDRFLLEKIARRQPQWAVNSLALAAIPELLSLTDLRAWSEGISILKEQLKEILLSYGLYPLDTDANWLLIPNATWIIKPLFERGILVRDCTNFGLDGVIRMAVPNESGLGRLDEAFSEIESSIGIEKFL